MIAYVYTCDACGKTGAGSKRGLSLVKIPPAGWKWCFYGPCEGPHACSAACWDKVKYAADGKLYLDWDHNSEEGIAPWQTATEPVRPMAIQLHPSASKEMKAPRKHPLRDKLETIELRVSALEGAAT